MASIRTILWSVNVLLVAGLAYAASVVVADVLEGELARNTSAPSERRSNGAADSRKRTAQPLQKFQAILDTNMFRAKRSGKSPAPVQVSTAIVAQTGGPEKPSETLPIKISLSGTFISDAGSIAFVIGPDGRTERTYRVKECLPRGDNTPVLECQPDQAKLVKVGSDHIVVTMNGGRYVVKLGMGTTVAATAPRKTRKNVRRNNLRGGRIKAGLGGKRRGKKNVFPSTRVGNNIDMRVPGTEVEKAFENFAGIVNQARVVPYMVDGQPQGFQIRKIASGSIFERLGLNNSDIIKSVNGESLTTADQALRLFSLFRNEREVALEIERNNQLIQLTYTIE